MNRKLAYIFAAVIGFPLLAQAEEPRARMGDTKEVAQFNKMIDDATSVYSAIAKGPQGEVPENILKKAQCIAVLPEVKTGALVVGATHGNGLASCQDANNKWSQPAAISLTQGSIGIQAGAKSTDLVLYFQSNEAVQALKRGELTLGADLSTVAGSYEKGVDTSSAGIVAYARTEGVFAGASVSGSKVGKDQEALDRFYGKKVDYTALLEGRESPDSTRYSEKLTKLFP